MKAKEIRGTRWTGLLGAALVLAVTPARTSAQETVTPLGTIPISASTGEKPQSKVWFHAGTWWAVLPSTGVSPTGTWLWRLEGDHTWTNVLHLSSSTGKTADAKAVGDVSHVLLHGNPAELVSVEYVSSSNTYALWTGRPTTTSIALSGSETATIDIDSVGRMWLATESGSNVLVYYSDFPYSGFAGPVILANNINGDDIAVVTALPDGTIGVLWSNQNTQRFGFKRHQDGTDPLIWSADEVPAGSSALNVGAGMADDHLNVAVATDGTLYAAVKTSYDTTGYPKIAFLVRRPNVIPPNDPWDSLYQIDQAGTRGIVLLNEDTGKVRVVYTSSEGLNDIVFKESSLSPISFGSRQTLMTGGLNNATSTKMNWSSEVVVLASSGTSAAGVLITVLNTACGNGIVGAGEGCDDGNTASGDGCSATCQVEPCFVCAGQPSVCSPNDTAPCTDGLFCTGTDTCSGGTCSVHSGDPCSGPDGDGDCAESCDEATDSCTASDPDGSACTDGLFCTGTDTCSGGTCSGHTGNPCAGGPECADTCDEGADSCLDPPGTGCTDDGNPCTVDECDGSGACDHPAGNLGAVCRPAGNPCDVAENCDGAGVDCPPDGGQPDGTPCNDGNACTNPDACLGGVCKGPCQVGTLCGAGCAGHCTQVGGCDGVCSCQ